MGLNRLSFYCLPSSARISFSAKASIWILRALKKWKTFYLRGKNVIWVSDLVYRLKDNARLFFIVSIISAVAFTATGVLAMYKSTVGAEESAYEMEYLSYSGNPKEQTHLKKIDHELKTHGFTYKKDKINVSYVRYQEGETVPPCLHDQQIGYVNNILPCQAERPET